MTFTAAQLDDILHTMLKRNFNRWNVNPSVENRADLELVQRAKELLHDERRARGEAETCEQIARIQ